MLVRATGTGFVDSHRQVGDEFEIADHLFSASWMEKWNPGSKKFEPVELTQDEAHMRAQGNLGTVNEPLPMDPNEKLSQAEMVRAGNPEYPLGGSASGSGAGTFSGAEIDKNKEGF